MTISVAVLAPSSAPNLAAIPLTVAAAVAQRNAGTLLPGRMYQIIDAPDVAGDGSGTNGAYTFIATAANHIPMQGLYTRAGLNETSPFPCTFWADQGPNGTLLSMRDPRRRVEVKGGAQILAFPWGAQQITESELAYTSLTYADDATIRDVRAFRSSIDIATAASVLEDVDLHSHSSVQMSGGARVLDGTLGSASRIVNMTGGINRGFTMHGGGEVQNQSLGLIEECDILSGGFINYQLSTTPISRCTVSNQSSIVMNEQTGGVMNDCHFTGFSFINMLTAGSNNNIAGINASGRSRLQFSGNTNCTLQYSDFHAYGSATLNGNDACVFRYLDCNSNAGLRFEDSVGCSLDRVNFQAEVFTLFQRNTNFSMNRLSFMSGARIIMRDGIGFTGEMCSFSDECNVDADNCKDGMFWLKSRVEAGNLLADQGGIWLNGVKVTTGGTINAVSSAVGSPTSTRLLHSSISDGAQINANGTGFTGMVQRTSVSGAATLTVSQLKAILGNSNYKGGSASVYSMPASEPAALNNDIRAAASVNTAVSVSNQILP